MRKVWFAYAFTCFVFLLGRNFIFWSKLFSLKIIQGSSLKFKKVVYLEKIRCVFYVTAVFVSVVGRLRVSCLVFQRKCSVLEEFRRLLCAIFLKLCSSYCQCDVKVKVWVCGDGIGCLVNKKFFLFLLVVTLTCIYFFYLD